MIGNPYEKSVTLNNIQAVQGGVSSDLASISNIWISPFFYSWDPVNRVYSQIAVTVGTNTLDPLVGYWVKARQAGVSLVITKPQ